MYYPIYVIFLLLSYTISVFSLDCYLCAENNLDEFGECKQQFRLDCSSYASKFGQNEKIFCRTRRQKSAQNNTYTIVKECIAENDHYQNFPRKNYELDEECDLIEVQNYEVAYCLCKTNLCNEPPIVDQFTNFEKKYPELFGKMPEENEKHIPPTQESIEDSFAPPPSINGDLRRQPTSRPSQENSNPNANSFDLKELSVNAPGIFVGNVGGRPLANDGKHDSISSFNGHDLICAQCGQGNLTDELSDCDKQISVNCAQQVPGDGKKYCFTRQIIVGHGQNAIEKMCVGEQNIKQEFSMEKVIEGCGEFSEHIRYCVCSSSNCNSLSIIEQVALGDQFNGNHEHSSQTLSEMPSISDKFEGGKPAKNLQITSLTPKIEAPAVEPASSVDNLPPLNCQVCADDNVKDDQSDCLRTTVIDCAQQSKSPKTACLTRTTVLYNGKVSVEKRCINEKEAEHFVKNSRSFTGKDIQISPMGTVCGVTEDISTKFCLCDSDMCNRFALKEQIQQYEYYFPTSAQTTTMTYENVAPSTSTRRSSTRPQATTSKTEIEFIEKPHDSGFMPATSPSQTSPEEVPNSKFEESIRNSINEQRKKKWKDLTFSEQSNSSNTIFVNTFISALITMLIIVHYSI